MPVVLHPSRQSRSVLKLSLGVTTATILILIAAIFVAGAPEAYSGTAYTTTGGCGGTCNWSDTTKWSPTPPAGGPGQAAGDTANINFCVATVNVDVVVPNGVIVNLGCTGTTLGIPGAPTTNHLTIEPSSSMGSGGNTINISGGDLTINSGGTFTNTNGNTIVLNSGTASNLGAFNNSGIFTINGGVWTSSAPINILGLSTFTLAGGTLTNNSTTIVGGAVAGTMNWTGGTIDGGGILQVQGGALQATVNINGAGPTALSGVQLANSGAVNYSPTNPLALISGGNISNALAFSLGNDTAINGDGTGAIANSGTFTKTAGVATTNVNVAFSNSGTVTFGAAGLGLGLNGGGTQTGAFNLRFANPMSFNGTHFVNAGTTFTAGAGPVTIAGGNFKVNTNLNLPGNLINNGTLGFGGTTQTLTVTGNYTQGATGTLIVPNINGPTAGTNYSFMNIGGTTALAGTLNATLGFAAASGQLFTIINGTSPVAGDFTARSLTGCCGDGLIENPPTSQIILQAVALADMAVTEAGPASVADGQNATFTVKAGNGGPATATNVMVTDSFAGGTFVSATPTGAGSCSGTGPITCTWPSIANLGAEFVTVVLKAGLAPGPLSNTASVTANEADTNPGNNTVTATATITPVADVAVGAITGAPNPVNAGQPATWSVTLRNAGPDTASNTSANLSLSGGTISSFTPPGGFTCTNTATTVSCVNGTLAPGNVTISVTATAPGQTPWTLTATVISGANDPVPGNNTGTGTVTVNPVADVSIVKTGPANLIAGSSVTYNLFVQNAGPSTATNVTLNDTAPGLNFFSTDIPGCGSLPCNVGSYASGSSRTYTVTFNVPLSASGSITNTATANGTEPDPNSANNTSSLTLPVVQQADLSVTKRGPATATPGTNVTFTITVMNNGPSIATGVTLDDPTPARLTFVSATAPCASGFASPCALGTINPGLTKVVNVTYSVQPGGAVTITNKATVSSTSTDPTASNNSATASISIGTCPSAPTSQQPPDGSTNQQTSGVLIWSDAGAASYNVYLGPAGTGCSTLLGTTKSPAIQYSGLQGGITYEWRVESVTPGCSARTSACIKFTTTGSSCATTPPTLTSPLNTTVTGQTTFTWSSVAGAKDYQLFVNGNLIATTTATSFGPTSVSNGPTTWFVVAEFDPPCASLTSATGTYNSCDTSNSKTIPSIVAQSDAGQTYTLFWDAVASATKYEVDEATDVNFTNPTTLSTTTTSMSFTHPVTVPTAFFYRVRAFIPCANGFGPNSVSVRIVLSPVTAPSNPNVSAPSGSNTLIPIVVHIAGFADGSFPFTASLDPQEPWLVRVDPSTGVLPPEGINLTVYADPAGLPTGTHTGTVIVLVTTPSSGGLAANGTTPVGAPVSISLVTPVTPKASGVPPANSLIIPSTGHLDGINSRWASDVRILNNSLQTVHYQITFTPDDVSQGVKQTVIATTAGATTALDDVVKTWYGVGSLGESSNGSLEIRPLDNPAKTGSNDAPSISFTTVASSRTYNAAPNSAAGTLAEFIPAILFQNFVGKAVDSSHAATILSLQQVAQNDAMRTNFGVMEASGQPVSVLVSVFDATGNKLLDVPLALLGGQHAQLNGFLTQNHISLPDGRIQAQVVGGDGKITAYASVIDNKSGDPMLISGVPLGQDSADHFVLAGVADLNTGLAAWRTDMRIFNPTTSAQNAQLTFYPVNNQGQPQSTTIGINPGEVKQLNNTLQSVFGLTNTGGAIHVQTSTTQPLVVSGRTYNLTSNGTYGQLLTAVTAADAIGKGDQPFQILQTEDSVRLRTNVGLFEVTGKPATVEVSVVLPDSKFSPSTQIPLPANGFVQIPVIQSFGLSNVYNARVSLRVVDGDGRIGAYGSVIDQVTQAPTYIPAQH